jgi:hypothetical protein
MWITRVVDGKKFVALELPDINGRIKYPDAMPSINLLCVLEGEPVTCELEQMVMAELEGISQAQVFIELMGNQIAPEVAKSVMKFNNETAGVKKKYQPKFHMRC